MVDLASPITWVWIVIWWLLLWLFFFLSLWIMEGKAHAKRVLWATALVAIIAILLIPLLQALSDINIETWHPLAGIAPYVAYFVVIFLLKGLADVDWRSAVIAGFLGILFVLITYNIFLAIPIPGAETMEPF